MNSGQQYGGACLGAAFPRHFVKKGNQSHGHIKRSLQEVRVVSCKTSSIAFARSDLVSIFAFACLVPTLWRRRAAVPVSRVD